MKYIGLGCYVSEWEKSEGGVKRKLFDIQSGAEEQQFAATDKPHLYQGTYATFPEIASGTRPTNAP